jgi:hypothetical protein
MPNARKAALLAATLPCRAGRRSRTVSLWSGRPAFRRSAACHCQQAMATDLQASFATASEGPRTEGGFFEIYSGAMRRHAAALAQQDDRGGERDDQDGQHAQLDEEMAIDLFGSLFHFAELGCQHENAADDRDQADEQEGRQPRSCGRMERRWFCQPACADPGQRAPWGASTGWNRRSVRRGGGPRPVRRSQLHHSQASHAILWRHGCGHLRTNRSPGRRGNEAYL